MAGDLQLSRALLLASRNINNKVKPGKLFSSVQFTTKQQQSSQYSFYSLLQAIVGEQVPY